MKRSTTLTTLALASALALAGCAAGGGEEETTGAASETAATPAAAGAGSTDTATAAPSGSAEEISEEHNDADVMFAQMMIPHHQQAVQMSEIMLAKDNLDPQIQQLAQKIVAAQGPEIEQLQAMLETWGEPTSMESGGMEGMDHGSTGSASGSGMEGMMTEEDMGQLEAAEGDEAARLFLTQMTEHHRGAIDMAQEEVANGQNRQAIAMAQKVVKDQEAEIQEMNTLLERFQG